MQLAVQQLCLLITDKLISGVKISFLLLFNSAKNLNTMNSNFQFSSFPVVSVLHSFVSETAFINIYNAVNLFMSFAGLVTIIRWLHKYWKQILKTLGNKSALVSLAIRFFRFVSMIVNWFGIRVRTEDTVRKTVEIKK